MLHYFKGKLPLASVASALIAPCLAVAPAQAQDDSFGPSERDSSYSVSLNQDTFFGFYPAFNGLVPVSDNMDFSFYGILWNSEGLDTTGTNDLWTEFGAGVALYYMDDNLVVKPQLGILSGTLLSGGTLADDGVTQTGGANVLDGVVPNLTMNYSDDTWEAEFYGGYYLALRNRNNEASLDFIHTWVNAGYKVLDFVSFGGHLELLTNTRNTFPGGATARNYLWLGPYVQFTTDNGFFAKFTGGVDLGTDQFGDGNFYKLNVGFSF